MEGTRSKTSPRQYPHTSVGRTIADRAFAARVVVELVMSDVKSHIFKTFSRFLTPRTMAVGAARCTDERPFLLLVALIRTPSWAL